MYYLDCVDIRNVWTKNKTKFDINAHLLKKKLQTLRQVFIIKRMCSTLRYL